ncbi:META domain-containing protein [Serinibacter salmoneus]|uniref:Heat shock protein HslJ n=1 Tax=Serinibacter salmoneus TaxID=556530 RepID=A0A2A9CVY1_9MICO|nr:META domain-containing protein [Serinibacter salmoneus]PFG18577.1 heat shock protein HslJ [Serinibacter salmoneus]
MSDSRTIPGTAARRTILATAGAAALLLAACTSPSGDTADSGADDDGEDTSVSSDDTGDANDTDGDSQMIRPDDLDIAGAWVLTDNPDITLEIAPDGATTGFTGCNTLGAVITRDPTSPDGQLVVGDLSYTEIGCESDVMAAEAEFLAALDAVIAGQTDADGLTLTTLDGVDLTFTQG